MLSIILLTFLTALAADPPTLYEYYTSDGITSGLSTAQSFFTLNGKNISIYSGAIHYFRVPRAYWRDRLRKLRAAGLNTVETYVPWNMHEYEFGKFDFGDGGSDMEDFLDVREFIKTAQEEDLFVILRPGPYICSEFEFGGLPSYLLTIEGVTVRTSTYLTYVERYFRELFRRVVDLQFVIGGAIVAFQVENEYAYAPDPKDYMYLEGLVDIFRKNGVVELLVSSDGARMGSIGTIPGVILQTINFGTTYDPVEELDQLLTFQSGKPAMVMEFWSGHFDAWTDQHHEIDNATFREVYEKILTYPASINLYMFHGGSNWGYYNGAINTDDDYTSIVLPVTTSYDYVAPLSEAGDYTAEYYIIKELLETYNPVKLSNPEMPRILPRAVYSSIPLQSQLKFLDLINQISPTIFSQTPLSMEELEQSFGYVVYRQEIDIPANSVLTISGHIHDTLLVLVNGKLLQQPLRSSEDFNGFGYWKTNSSTITLTETDLKNSVLDLVVEGWGRVNAGQMNLQFKGLGVNNTVTFDGQDDSVLWQHFPLEFKTDWTRNLSGWEEVDGFEPGPILYRAILSVDAPRDTYVDMRGWSKGMVIINGFLLGKYAAVGPQQAIYLPGAFLKVGNNELLVFEHFAAGEKVRFSADPIYETL